MSFLLIFTHNLYYYSAYNDSSNHQHHCIFITKYNLSYICFHVDDHMTQSYIIY